MGLLINIWAMPLWPFFGAPVHYNDHPQNACRCALESIKKLFELEKEYKAQNLPAIDIGIGLNTGECSVGNMGSQNRS